MHAELGDHAGVLDKKVVYVPVHGLKYLAAAVRELTRNIGQDEIHEFVGRISIVKRRIPHLVQLPTISEKFNGHFKVDKLFLMQAINEHGQVHYHQIDAVPLGRHCRKCGVSGNLFIAVVPPKAVTKRLGSIQYQYCTGRGEVWVPTSGLHVTIRFLGNMDKGAAIHAFRKLRSLHPVKGVTVRKNAEKFIKQVYAPVSGLDGLAHAVLQKTHNIGESPKFNFKGHITLASAYKGNPLPNVNRDLTDHFDVNELVLMQSSTDGSGQKIYDIIDRTPLSGN
jgi:2'-5' RNA ligase